jgi:hypothetical protein
VGARVLERVAHDPVHALVGVDLFLNRDLVRRAGLESSTDADVDTLGVLAKDHEVHVGARAALERTESVVEEADRPVVDVQVELESGTEQDVARVPIVGHARIAERADEDGVERSQRVVAVCRNRFTGGEIMIGAPRQMMEMDSTDRFEDLHSLGGHFLTDPVSGDHRDSMCHESDSSRVSASTRCGTVGRSANRLDPRTSASLPINEVCQYTPHGLLRTYSPAPRSNGHASVTRHGLVLVALALLRRESHYGGRTRAATPSSAAGRSGRAG